MVFFFFFASTERSVNLVEPSVGPCQFCEAKASIDIVERRSKTWWFGFIPMTETVDRLAVCHSCGTSIKEAYYTRREPFQDDMISPAAVVEEKYWNEGDS